ncbi:MAG: MoaD/ThiS family protein [Bacillota bacterium]
MEKETILVKVKVEGIYPPGEDVVELPHGATLKVLLDNLKNMGNRFVPYLFDAKTGEYLVKVALINDESVLQKDFKRVTLLEGDRVFFILLVSGG